MTVRSALINVMAAAAHKAARGLVRDFGEVEQLQVSRKGTSDFVSEGDRRAERVLRQELSKARPKFGFLMEEAGAIEGVDKDKRWIVDPLDGTTNFLHGLPHFAISIGYELEGEITAGVIYDPLRDEMFWAEKGIGSFVNDRRLRVSGRTKLEEALFATGIPFGDRPGKEEFLEILRPMMQQTAGVRRWGVASLDLAYVAAGRFDGFWERGLSPWDVAAGLVLVREAGGFVTDFAGDHDNVLNSGDVVAGNTKLHEILLGMVRGGRVGPTAVKRAKLSVPRH